MPSSRAGAILQVLPRYLPGAPAGESLASIGNRGTPPSDPMLESGGVPGTAPSEAAPASAGRMAASAARPASAGEMPPSARGHARITEPRHEQNALDSAASCMQKYSLQHVVGGLGDEQSLGPDDTEHISSTSIAQTSRPIEQSYRQSPPDPAHAIPEMHERALVTVVVTQVQVPIRHSQ